MSVTQIENTYDLVAKLYVHHEMSPSMIKSHLASNGIQLTKGQIARAVDKHVPKEKLRGKNRVRSSVCYLGNAIKWLDQACPKDIMVSYKFIIYPEIRMVADLFHMSPTEIGHHLLQYRKDGTATLDRNLSNQKCNPNYLLHKEMFQLLEAGEAIDISQYPRDGKHYVLPELIQDVDYCDATRKKWVQSVAIRKSDGVLLASLELDLFKSPTLYDCMWVK